MSVFLATYFEKTVILKLFPVIYANYRPMTDDRRQTETVHHIRYTTMFSPCSKHHSWFLHLIIIFWRGALCHNYTLFHHVSNNAIPYLMLKMSNNAIPYHMLKMHYTIKLNTNINNCQWYLWLLIGEFYNWSVLYMTLFFVHLLTLWSQNFWARFFTRTRKNSIIAGPEYAVMPVDWYYGFLHQ